MQSKTKMLVVLVVAVSVGLVIAACGGSQPDPGITVEDLTGLWQQEKTFMGQPYLQLNENGSYRVATAEHWLEKAPLEEGQYRLEGTVLMFITSNESRDCRSQQGSYKAELTEQDQLQLTLQEETCQFRANTRPGSWHQISP